MVHKHYDNYICIHTHKSGKSFQGSHKNTFSGKTAGKHNNWLDSTQICVSNTLSLNNQIGSENDGVTQESIKGTSLVVQWLRLQAPNAGA